MRPEDVLAGRWVAEINGPDIDSPSSSVGVYAANPRGRAFWERLGWRDTGERSRGPMPPHAELRTYELVPPPG